MNCWYCATQYGPGTNGASEGGNEEIARQCWAPGSGAPHICQQAGFVCLIISPLTCVELQAAVLLMHNNVNDDDDDDDDTNQDLAEAMTAAEISEALQLHEIKVPN